MRIYLFILTVIVFSIGIKAQDSTAVADSVPGQDSTMYHLKKTGEVVLSRQADSIRLPAHQQFKSKVDSLLKATPDTFLVLDSIRNLSVLTNPDSTLRVITWLFPFDNGAYKFYGYVKYFNPVDSTWQLQRLNDRHKEIENPEISGLSTDNWYGALYYDMIVKEDFITLLGWNGYHNELNQKVIDILHYNEEGEPFFGKDVFAGYKDSVKRVILEYSEDVSITLEHDLILHEVTRPSENAFMDQPRTEKKKQKMIYFNKLDPIQPMFEGDRRYYVPLSEKMHGFYFSNKRWNFIDKLIILSTKVEEEEDGEELNSGIFD